MMSVLKSLIKVQQRGSILQGVVHATGRWGHKPPLALAVLTGSSRGSATTPATSTASATTATTSSSSSGSSSMPADYRIAVPSYKRSHTLQRNTLASLAESGIDCSSRVDIFVANEQEAEQYARALAPGTYASIQMGVLGIGRQRDFILDHYGAGQQVVMMDDDIMWFNHVYQDVQLDLHRAILKGFELSHQHDCYLWGINNSNNTFFMRPTYSVGWCYFQGPFMGFRVRDGVRLHPEHHQLKEDVQYSLMHCDLDNKTLRINGIGLKARPYGKEPGGLQSYHDAVQRADLAHANQQFLMQRFGRYIAAWGPEAPHPRMRGSPQHRVQQLAPEELYR